MCIKYVYTLKPGSARLRLTYVYNKGRIFPRCAAQIEYIYVSIVLNYQKRFRLGAYLPVVQFQKGRHPRSQLTELYLIRVEQI